MRRMGGTSDIVYVAEGMILLGLTFRRRFIVCKSEGVQVELTKECMKMGGTTLVIISDALMTGKFLLHSHDSPVTEKKIHLSVSNSLDSVSNSHDSCHVLLPRM